MGERKPLDPDFAEYVLRVIGPKRVAAYLDLPVEEWPLTERMRNRIKAYPHGIVAEADGTRPYAGGEVTWHMIECACGKKFGADHMLRLRSHAYEAWARHAGHIHQRPMDAVRVGGRRFGR